MDVPESGDAPFSQAQQQYLHSEFQASRVETQEKFERLFAEITRVGRDSEKRDNELKKEMQRLTQIAIDSAETAKTLSEKVLSWKDMLQDHEARLGDHNRRLGTLEAKS